MQSKIIGVSEAGRAVGCWHPRSKFTEADVNLIFELYFPPPGVKKLGYRAIAKKFECDKSTIKNIILGRSYTPPRRWLRVPERG